MSGTDTARTELESALAARLLAEHLARPGADEALNAAAAELSEGRGEAEGLAAGLMARTPRLDHLGVAVDDVDAARRFWIELTGLADGGSEEVPSEGVRVTMLQAGEAKVELLEAFEGAGPVAKFLQRRGPGIHHVCFKTDDIVAVLDRLREGGVEILGQAPRAGAGGCQVAFLHPRSTGGILVELSQPPS
ncbi:MAG: methylmalonyl-CoA epimerase [Acidobacteriota bacterium]